MRYRHLSAGFLILLGFSSPLLSSVAIDMQVASLYVSSGPFVPAPDGTLIQIVVSTADSTFDDPTPGDYLGGSGDDIILAQFALDRSTAFDTPGAHSESVGFTLGVNNVTVGDPFIVRWFPTLIGPIGESSTLGEFPSSPGFSTLYGQYRTDSVLDGSDIVFVIPPDAALYTLNIWDSVIAGGSLEQMTLTADMMTAIPEPSTYAFMIIGGFVLIAYFRRKV